MTSEELQSRTIDFIRFPLIVGVVFCHAYIPSEMTSGVNVVHSLNFPIYHYTNELFSKVIFAGLCSSSFFLMSGYLFFNKSEFNAASYKKKIKNRIKTLLIPYLFWNLAVILLNLIGQSLPATASMYSGASKLFKDYTFLDYVSAFWSQSDKFPICYQLWFIRDLMVVSLCAPLIKLMVDRLKVFSVIILGLLWTLNIWFYIPGVSHSSFFFFTAGAYLSINKLNIITQFKKVFTPTAIIYPVLVIIDLITKGHPLNRYIHSLEVLAGILFFFNLIAYYLEKGTIHNIKYLASASFFVYAAHEPLLSLTRKVIFKVLQPQSEGMLLSLYFIKPLLVVLITLGCYYVLRREVPRFTGLITGGRITQDKIVGSKITVEKEEKTISGQISGKKMPESILMGREIIDNK